MGYRVLGEGEKSVSGFKLYAMNKNILSYANGGAFLKILGIFNSTVSLFLSLFVISQFFITTINYNYYTRHYIKPFIIPLWLLTMLSYGILFFEKRKLMVKTDKIILWINIVSLFFVILIFIFCVYYAHVISDLGRAIFM